MLRFTEFYILRNFVRHITGMARALITLILAQLSKAYKASGRNLILLYYQAHTDTYIQVVWWVKVPSSVSQASLKLDFSSILLLSSIFECVFTFVIEI